MSIKTIKKETYINASKEKVWDILTKDEFNRIWFEEFSEGTTAKTDWQVGSKAIFTDHSGSGLVGKIVENKPGEILSIQYTGMISNGVEDYESTDAKNIMNSWEIYKLSEHNGVTYLEVASDMVEEYFEMMNASWDRAIEKIKDLAEKK